MQPLSIIILTRNRLAKLKVCLEKLLPQLAESDEIILIDTGSTDGTVEEFGPGADLSKAAGRDSRVQFHKFASEGSWAEARNLGVGHAVNSIIAFLDDDCYAAPDWIARGRAAMEEKGPAPCDAAGGLVLPHGIRDWPDWWDARMGWLVGISVPGHLTPAAGAHYYPYTSNLWARAELLRAEPFQELGGEFAEEEKERYQLGREDAEWWRRIRVKGYRTRFDAALRVEHHIEPERLTQDYLFARARRDGEAWARREGGRGDLEPIAYQWWRNAFPARGDAPEPAPPAGTEPPSPDRNPNSILYHQMMAARYRVAVKTLARKVAVGDHAGHSPTRIELRARLGAARRIIFDRSKTIARRAALAFSPPAVWVVPKERPSTLAIAAFGHVGDMVILQSFLRGFIEAYPNLPAAIIAPPSAESIFRTSPKVNLTVLSGPSSSSGEPREILHQWILKVRPRLIFAPYLHEPWGSAFVRLVHSIRQPEIPIIGFDQDTGLARRLDQERIALRIHKVMQEHESRNLERLVAGEISSPGGAPRFEFPEFKSESRPAKIEPELGALERMKAWRAGLPPEKSGRPMLMLNPDAGYAQKEWPDESWAELIGLLSDALPHLFVMNFSKPHPQLEGLIAANPALKSRVEPLRNAPLENLIAAMSLCEGIVTVDSAPQHLAHALGVPSLTLYGPMDERRWGDRRGRPIHQTIRGGNFDLTPEELRGLPENHLMRLITPRKLGEKILEWKSSTRTGYIHHEVVK